MATFTERVKRGWNAFLNNKDPSPNYGEVTSYSRPDRVHLTRGNRKTIIASIYNRMSLDVSSVAIKHVRVNENDQYLAEIPSGLNEVLNIEANVDQTGRALIQDIVLSMFDEGVIAVVPTDTITKPNSSSEDILEMRTAKITQWNPTSVRLNIYNERRGIREDITLPKSRVAIIENPFYAVMNEPNSTLQRLIRKIALSDMLDDQIGSNKLNMIIQLPYTVKTEAKKNYAEQRMKDVEEQLSKNKYGIAYIDSTEHITQLNRPLENNLMEEIDNLTNKLYSQLGMTEEILNGSANESVMLNYYNRAIEPILSAIVDEFKRKFLTKTARTQGQSIKFFRDPFKLVPVNNIADIADKFTRNEILSSNEVRGIIGFKPVADAKADELRNKNINAADGQEFANTNETENEERMEDYEVEQDY